MGLFNRKKKEAKAEKTEAKTGKTEINTNTEPEKAPEPAKASQAQGTQGATPAQPYIEAAGFTIVSKSILNGTSKLKWLFRHDNGQGNGWIAFGDSDTQEYVDNPDNMAVVDYNELIKIEPAAANVYYLPFGADLEFRADGTGSYFVDTATGEEIREQVLPPLRAIFEKNLKFLNKETYPEEFFRGLFQKGGIQEPYVLGKADFPTGEIVLSDPIVYLGTQYMVTLEQKIPAGSYPVELCICHSEQVGVRIAAAWLIISSQEPVRHEIAMPKGSSKEDLGKPGVWAFFGVDNGLACFTDARVAVKYREFISGCKRDNPGKNEYFEYFAYFFQKSYEKHPSLQRESGDFLLWQMPGTGDRLAMFESCMGDGIYSGYWGIDREGKVTELVVPFINPEFL